MKIVLFKTYRVIFLVVELSFSATSTDASYNYILKSDNTQLSTFYSEEGGKKGIP